MKFLRKLFRRKKVACANIVVPKLTNEIRSHREDTNQYLQQITQMLSKSEIRQKETVLQLDELSALIQDDSGQYDLVSALISAIDVIEDFYRLTIDDPSLSVQSQMMWNAAMKAATDGGLEVIDSPGQPPDFKLHRIEGTATDPNQPLGCILQTLKCGYLYNDKVIRTAIVLVNKEEVD